MWIFTLKFAQDFLTRYFLFKSLTRCDMKILAKTFELIKMNIFKFNSQSYLVQSECENTANCPFFKLV